MYNSNDNIIFFLEEKNETTKNNDEIQKILREFEDSYVEDYISINEYEEEELTYFKVKDWYINDELYYNTEYKIKDLLKICEYYGINTNIKKCSKKENIISNILIFESSPINLKIVQKRHKMWAYILELKNEKRMTKYIIW